MRNDSLTKRIIAQIDNLPYFSIASLKIIGAPDYQLRIALSRLHKKGAIVPLKKGLYVSARFIEKIRMSPLYTPYIEFIATKMYAPSYLSLDYVLYENNILTEVPVNFTLITKNKTLTISNKLGRFIYHKIKDAIFCGYRVEKVNGFLYYKADRAKALFDFLYLRKNIIVNKEMVKELRLNLEVLKRTEIARLKEYVEFEGSEKMKAIFKLLF